MMSENLIDNLFNYEQDEPVPGKIWVQVIDDDGKEKIAITVDELDSSAQIILSPKFARALADSIVWRPHRRTMT